MFACKFCDYVCSAVQEFTRHVKFHRNVPNFRFQCGVPECSRSFSKFEVLKSHIYRDHRSLHVSEYDKRSQLFDITSTCRVDFCSYTCSELPLLFSHLKSHIKDGVEVTCPFRACGKKFKVKSTFSSHLSRTHRNNSVELLADYICEAPTEQQT